VIAPAISVMPYTCTNSMSGHAVNAARSNGSGIGEAP